MNNVTAKVFAANARHAAGNNESVRIGGGKYSPDELRKVADVLDAAPDLLETVKEIVAMLESHPEAKEGNSKVHYCACVARTAIRKATQRKE